MNLAHPHLLWCLPAILALALIRLAIVARQKHQARSLGVGVPRLTASISRQTERLRTASMLLALALTALALAGPRSGYHHLQRQSRGANLVFLIDCSRSMMASDLYPNRLEVARRKAMDLLKATPEHRAALMPFAAVSYLRCPLTGDRNALSTMLVDCDPELFPARFGFQGTALGATVERALTFLGNHADRGQAIIIFSDGRDNDEAAVTKAVQIAKHAGIPVYGIYVADPERQVTLEIDGKPQVMDSSRESLAQLAAETGGICVNATTSAEDIARISEHLDQHLAKMPWQEESQRVERERYQVPLAIAMLLAVAGAFLPVRRRAGP